MSKYSKAWMLCLKTQSYIETTAFKPRTDDKKLFICSIVSGEGESWWIGYTNHLFWGDTPEQAKDFFLGRFKGQPIEIDFGNEMIYQSYEAWLIRSESEFEEMAKEAKKVQKQITKEEAQNKKLRLSGSQESLF